MTHEIAVIPGDGIGQEVTPAAVEVLDALPVDSEFVEVKLATPSPSGQVSAILEMAIPTADVVYSLQPSRIPGCLIGYVVDAISARGSYFQLVSQLP